MTRAERAKRAIESKAHYVRSIPDELVGPHWYFLEDLSNVSSGVDDHEDSDTQDHYTLHLAINDLVKCVRTLAGHVAFLEAYVADLEEELTGQGEVVLSVVLPTSYDLSPGDK